MDAGLVTSLSGALAQSKQVERVANNIANADTAGYKADELLFEEALQGAQHQDIRPDIPERALTSGELLSKAGEEKRIALYGREFNDFSSGAYKQTGSRLDFAIQGNGFFEVATPDGPRLTRSGSFSTDDQGRLVTREGQLVLGPGPRTGNLEARAINVGSAKITVDLEGNIYSEVARGGEILGQMAIVQVSDPSALKKRGQSLFEAPDSALVQAEGRAPAQAAAPGAEVKKNPLGSVDVAAKVHQGTLESSNVNAVAEMTKLIQAQRLFEQNTKLMQSFGNLNLQAAEIGKF